MILESFTGNTVVAVGRKADIGAEQSDEYVIVGTIASVFSKQQQRALSE